MAAREPEAVPLEQRSARAGRPQLLPLADEHSDPLLQLFDALPAAAAAEVERPVVNGGRTCVSTNTDCPSGHGRKMRYAVRCGHPQEMSRSSS